MRSELITFQTSDGFDLDGLVYTPEGDGARGLAALLVHGKTMNFYTGPGRILPPHLVPMGVSCLAMNRRGRDLGGIRDGRGSYGGAWERFGDSQLDIAAGLAELLDDPARRSALSTAAQQRAKDFTWAASAAVHREVYHRAAVLHRRGR